MNCGARLKARLTTLGDQAGQALVLTVLLLVVLLGFAGLALDVGHAYLVQRQLQSGVDAAALAGAQELPETGAATSTAMAYGPTPAAQGSSKPNDVTTVDNAVTTVSLTCLKQYGCIGTRAKQNGIIVSAKSVVPTWFARVLGRNSITVHASSTACSPCSAKGFDVQVILDRTGSMSGDDLRNAKQGVTQFLKAMDPNLDKVGLTVFPPVVANDPVSQAPSQNRFAYGYGAWWPSWDRRTKSGTPVPAGAADAHYTLAELGFDYLTQVNGTWVPNPSKRIVQVLGDVPAGGYTSYANSIVEAQHDLKLNGNGATPDGYQRGNAQNVIVFLTDGAANAMASHGWLPNPPVADGLPPFDAEFWGTTTVPDSNKNRPCDAGVNAAKWAKDQGTIVYAIGYGFSGGSNGENCGTGSSYTPRTTLQQIATDSTTLYLTPESADLGTVFELIAYDLRDRAGRLVPDTSK